MGVEKGPKHRWGPILLRQLMIVPQHDPTLLLRARRGNEGTQMHSITSAIGPKPSMSPETWSAHMPLALQTASCGTGAYNDPGKEAKVQHNILHRTGGKGQMAMR